MEETPKIHLFTPEAIAPRKRVEIGPGYDFYAPHSLIIRPLSSRIVHSNLTIQIPPNVFAKIIPISSSIYLECTATNIENTGYTQNNVIMVTLTNKLNRDFLLPRGTLLGRIVYYEDQIPNVIIEDRA